MTVRQPDPTEVRQKYDSVRQSDSSTVRQSDSANSRYDSRYDRLDARPLSYTVIAVIAEEESADAAFQIPHVYSPDKFFKALQRIADVRRVRLLRSW